ncbi:hypothetical protein GCM10010307_28390 [Streptomyces vastus]|uniref:Uncharacterized protein n=1 Tax=Streptomyces vastus TaxID=285451 RepID=A0ABN3QSM2_9ACTN
MLLHGPFRDAETVSYHRVRLAVTQCGEDLAFALRQERQICITHPWRDAELSATDASLFMNIFSV